MAADGRNDVVRLRGGDRALDRLRPACGRGWISSPGASRRSTCWLPRLVDEDGERAKIVAQADARLRQRATLAMGAATLLAAAERVDRDVPVDPGANADIEVGERERVARQGRGAGPRRDAERRERATCCRAMKRQHLEILSLRRQLAADRIARSRPEGLAPGTVDAATTSGWREGGEPAVSVIVPLYNDEDVVCEALDSVRRSTFPSWEIVVIDDASGDGGPRAVGDWMARHDSDPVAMFHHEVNRGLSAARNSGAEKARGRLFLMLDSDNLLRPYGLARLVRALAADPGAAFAYGILDRFDADGPVGLASGYAWEPWRLRHGNYIDALALIRRGPFTGWAGTPRTRGSCWATRTTISGRDSPRPAIGPPSSAASSAATGSGTARCSP